MEKIDDTNDNRIVFCMKLWIAELKQEPLNVNDWTEKGMIMHMENEILNGEYCSDEEYERYKMTGVVEVGHTVL